MHAWFPGMSADEAMGIIKALEILLFPGALAVLVMGVASFLR